MVNKKLALRAALTVVMGNSPGAGRYAPLRLGRLIGEKRANLGAVGRCLSAGSILLVAGKEQRLADTFAPEPAYIGIHGIRPALKVNRPK